MKRLRVTNKKGLFIGTAHHKCGAVADVTDDRQAARIVAQGFAEHVGVDPRVQPTRQATAAAAPEKAART